MNFRIKWCGLPQLDDPSLSIPKGAAFALFLGCANMNPTSCPLTELFVIASPHILRRARTVCAVDVLVLTAMTRS